MSKRVELARISTGDIAYRYDKSIVVFFNGRRKVLSTSVYNGGYHEDFSAVFNHDGTRGAGMTCELLADTYVEHMRLIAKRLGLNPDTVTGMGTAAHMENVSVKSLSYEDLTVTAIVTGGIETNGGRVGDPADYFKKLEKPDRPGTINIILVLDTDMPAGTLARALVTCTEAKTAAIQELMEGSHYSNGLATGSGTDQTMIVANADSELYLDGAGKHSKLGELIGKTVMAAVKEALNRQSGLNAASQHDLLKRLQRFGISEASVWADYQASAKDACVRKPLFLEQLFMLKNEDVLVSYGVLYIHLYDEYLWGLLQEKEVKPVAEKLIFLMAEHCGIAAPAIAWDRENGVMEAVGQLLAAAVKAALAEKEGEPA